MKKLSLQFPIKKLYNKQFSNLLQLKSMENAKNLEDSNITKDIPNYKDLCIYCFDVLINHLKNSNSHASFPEKFKTVFLFNLRNPILFLLPGQ